MDFLENELKRPMVSKELIDYLRATYSVDLLMDINNINKTIRNNDEHIGFLKGIQEVITRLDVLRKEREVEI